MKDKNQVEVSTLRLIRAAVQDRDIAARSRGNEDGISETEILQVLQTMIRQRQESEALYREGGRAALAERELQEIDIIRQFMPRQLSDDEVASAIDGVIAETGAGSLKDMGKVMGVLRTRYSGQIDLGKASAELKARLSS